METAQREPSADDGGLCPRALEGGLKTQRMTNGY